MLGNPPAGAGDGVSLTEEVFFTPFPKVLSATRLVQPLSEAPVAMTVIDREMIEASSAISVPELLRLVPGFQVTYAEGIEAVSTYHGYADSFPRRMQVLVDGRSVYTPAINGIVWAGLPTTLEQVERIEVVRGPNAAAFGSNAFLGTINIVTRSPETRDFLTVRTMTGSEDTFEAQMSHAGQVDRLSYSIDASSSKSDSFPNKADSNESRILSGQAVYRPTDKDSLSFNAGLRDTDFDSEAFRFLRHREYRSAFQQLRWSHQRSDTEDISVQLYHNAFDSPDRIIDPAFVDFSLFTDRYDVELQHNLVPADDLRLSWGAGYRWDITNAPGLLNRADDVSRDTARLFANLEWRASDSTVVNLGLMGERFSDLGNYVSPRAAINWHFADRQTLRVSAARAYRVPTMVERYGDLRVLSPPLPELLQLVGTPDTKPEQIDAYEVGYLLEVPSIKGTFDIRLFHSRVEDLIADAGDQSIFPPQNPFLIPVRLLNAGTLETKGLELQADFRPMKDNLVHLAYAYVEGGGTHINKILSNGQPLISPGFSPFPNEGAVPKHTLTALVSQHLSNDWRISVTYYHVSEMEWLGEGFHADALSRFDAKLSKRFRQTDGDIHVSLTIQNLLDEPHWEFTPSDSDVNGNLMERRVYAQVAFSFR